MFHILSRLSQIKYYKKNDIICDYDSNERALYVIAHGNVGVYVTKQLIENNNNNEQKNINTNTNNSNIKINEKDDTITLINNDANSSNNDIKNNNMNTPISSHKRISQQFITK